MKENSVSKIAFTSSVNLAHQQRFAQSLRQNGTAKWVVGNDYQCLGRIHSSARFILSPDLSQPGHWIGKGLRRGTILALWNMAA